MLTKEQINSLKKGDKVLAEVEVVAITESGQLLLKSLVEWPLDQIYPLPTPPKYDPTRRFKAGDKVRIVQYKGRYFNLLAYVRRGKEAEVLYDEEENVLIKVCFSGTSDMRIDPAYLELVTPVEENKPYSVFNNVPGKACEVRKANKTTAAFYYGSAAAYTEEEAEALAQVVCDRLNKEYRKEENHGQND